MSQYPPYSPQRPNFFHEPYNNTSQTYQPNAHYPQSPRRPNIGSPLPPPSSTIPQHVGAPSPYQPLTSSPTYQPQRPFSSHHHHNVMSTPYEAPSSTHAHPHSRQGSLLQSPTRDYTPLTNGTSRDPLQAEARPQSQGVSCSLRTITPFLPVILIVTENRSNQQPHVLREHPLLHQR